jgi:hypothetical protein
MKLLGYLGILPVFILASYSLKDKDPIVKNYLGIQGPIQYNNSPFDLAWSSHPGENYFKQEYLLPDEKPETFTQMLLLEALVGSISLEEAVRVKISELEHRKKTDPLVNYQLTENPKTGEFLLDFVVSSSPGNKLVVEWNAYRYINLQDKSGKEGVLLFGYSKRSYGEKATGFMKKLKTERITHISTLGNYKVPKIKF